MRKNRLSSGFSPQKHGWKAQRKVREPLGFVRGPSFESMAIVFAIDGACIPIRVWLAYSPRITLRVNGLRLRQFPAAGESPFTQSTEGQRFGCRKAEDDLGYGLGDVGDGEVKEKYYDGSVIFITFAEVWHMMN